MPKRFVAVVIGLLGVGAPAWAADYYLEGPSHEDRADVVTQTRAASTDGYKARVVRRYSQGDGWRYLLRVEGFEDEAVARQAAAVVAAKIGQTVSVYAAEGDEAREVATAAPEAAPTSPEPVPDLATEDAASVLKRAVKAHGGPKAGKVAVEASEHVVFTFRRTLPTGTVADHTWGRRGNDRYLQIAVTQGEGQSSRMVLKAEKAWLAVGEGGYEPVDLARARETLASFDPHQVVPFVLVFAEAVETRREFESMQLEGTGDVDGRQAVVLAFEGDRSSGPMRMKLDARTWHVLEVSFDDGELLHRFDGYRTIAGVVVPGRVRTWRSGALVDTVEIQDLDVDGAPPEKWFDAE